MPQHSAATVQPYEAELAKLRGDLAAAKEQGSAFEAHYNSCLASRIKEEARAEAAEAHAAELRAACDRIRHWHCWGKENEGMVVSSEAVRELWKVLTRTPAHSLATIQARALREVANLIRQTTPSRTSQWDDYGSGKEDGRHYAIEQIEAEADRLEKEAEL